MAALAIGLVWVGYTGALWGYCLLRGYNVTPKMLLSSQWPPSPSAVNAPPPSSGNSGTSPGIGAPWTPGPNTPYRPPGSK